jgi:hypothetical protein
MSFYVRAIKHYYYSMIKLKIIVPLLIAIILFILIILKKGTIMDDVDLIRGPRGEVVKKTRSNHELLIHLFNTGINLLINANKFLQPEADSIDPMTSEGSSKIAVWRFLSTLPISLTWSFDTALCGDYGISKNILRLSLEESIKLAYYSEFPESALKQVVHSKDKDEKNISEMLKDLDLPQKSGLLKLHGNLSNFYAHANFNIPPEIAYDENESVAIGGGSRYDPDIFKSIVKQLMILNCVVFKYIYHRFPTMYMNTNLLGELEKYFSSVKGLDIPVQDITPP